MPHDIRLSTRGHHHQQQHNQQQQHKLAHVSAGPAGHAANGRYKQSLLLLHADSPRTPRSDHTSWRGCWLRHKLCSHRNLPLWALCMLLGGAVAIRHATRLLDAAGQQQHHHLLQPQQARSGGAAALAAGAAARGNSSWGGGLPANASAAEVLAAQHMQWPGGYVAICAIVKDQWPDLRYWVEYHRWIGVSKFYIFDHNSTLPSLFVLWDYMQQGLVDYQYFLGRPRKRPDFTDTNQYRAYQACLLQHFRRHRWIAYIDADEFLVLPEHANASSSSSSGSNGSSGSSSSGAGQAAAGEAAGGGVGAGHAAPAGTGSTASSSSSSSHSSGANSSSSSSSSSSSGAVRVGDALPLLLHKYEEYAALGVNWIVFGSSGWQTRPPAGPLASYTSCLPASHWESTHVKVIANTGGILGLGYTPHEVITRPDRVTVDIDMIPYRGPRTPVAKWHKLVLHHYVVKSRAEFVSKKTRGSGAGNRKDWPYWNYIEQLSNSTCTQGVAISAAFMASKPRLALPAPARVTHDCHKRAAAAYAALLTPVPGEGGAAGGAGAVPAAAAAGATGSTPAAAAVAAAEAAPRAVEQRLAAGRAGVAAGSGGDGGADSSIDQWLPC